MCETESFLMEILFFEFLITPRCTKTLKEKFDFVEME
jgi:hypothetical protein